MNSQKKSKFKEFLEIVFDSGVERDDIQISNGRFMFTLRNIEDQLRVKSLGPPSAIIVQKLIQQNIVPDFCSTITAKNNSIDWIVFLGTRYRHVNTGNEYYLALVPPSNYFEPVKITYVLSEAASKLYRYAH